MDPAGNLRKVRFYPEIPNFPPGDAAVQYFLDPFAHDDDCLII
jgi:hypothetical protein